jgi:hypothetical protein
VVEVGLILRAIKKGPFAEQEAFAESATGEPAAAPKGRRLRIMDPMNSLDYATLRLIWWALMGVC